MKKLISLRITSDSLEMIDQWAKESKITRTEQMQKMLDWAIRTKVASQTGSDARSATST